MVGFISNISISPGCAWCCEQDEDGEQDEQDAQDKHEVTPGFIACAAIQLRTSAQSSTKCVGDLGAMQFLSILFILLFNS
jgi:hypothetical protein